MKKEYSISIYHDTRRIKKNGKYPVKLRVYSSNPRRQKFLPTVFELTETEFENTWLSKKPRKEFKGLRLKLQGLENTANSVAETLTPFSINELVKRLYRNKSDGVKVNYHYKEYIQKLNKEDRLGTADSYKYSEKAIKGYLKSYKKTNYNNLTFFDIDKDWLTDFEQCLTKKGLSITTIGIYLKALRAIFNKAISENEIDEGIYPFGKRKYQIPSSKGTKKALGTKQLKLLFDAKPMNKQQIIAKDFWFFSYSCNGMNIKDVALLKFKDIDEETIRFYRAKTRFTSKTDLKLITVYQNNYTNEFIEKYSNKDKSSENYVFKVLSNSMSSKEQRAKIKNFTRFVNQHIKKLAESVGLSGEISTYWARHSFATTSIRKGASMELMQESLGHKDLKTTQSYFDGFEDETKKELANKIMDF
ncbi:site-specific integrase [Flavobacteriaceae sp. LMIT009]